MSATFIEDFAETLLAAAGNGMVAAGCAPIGHAFTTAGDPVFDDGICCPGLLTVSWGTLRGTNAFPVPLNLEPLRCVPPTTMVDYTVTVARCFPAAAAGPGDDEIIEASAVIGMDQYVVWRAVVCFLLAQVDADDGVQAIVNQSMINGPEGGCVSAALSVTVGFDDLCFCESAEPLGMAELLVALFGDSTIE